MRKYGIEHFHIELIEETDNPEEREIYWIEKKQSFKNGYNATIGGDGRKYIDYDLVIATYPVSSGFSGEELDFTLQLSIDNYPESLDDTSNYNLKELSPIGTITNLYYTTPKLTLDNLDLRSSGSIIYNKYMPKDSNE